MSKCDPIQRHISSSLLLGSTPPAPGLDRSSFGQAVQTPDCLNIPISSRLSRFCLKIPNPTGKVPISTRVVIFSSNSHKRKRNVEYCDQITEGFFLTEIVVLENQKWHFRASRFENFLGGRGHAPRLDPLAKGALGAEGSIPRKILSQFKALRRLDIMKHLSFKFYSKIWNSYNTICKTYCSSRLLFLFGKRERATLADLFDFKRPYTYIASSLFVCLFVVPFHAKTKVKSLSKTFYQKQLLSSIRELPKKYELILILQRSV